MKENLAAEAERLRTASHDEEEVWRARLQEDRRQMEANMQAQASKSQADAAVAREAARHEGEVEAARIRAEMEREVAELKAAAAAEVRSLTDSLRAKADAENEEERRHREEVHQLNSAQLLAAGLAAAVAVAACGGSALESQNAAVAVVRAAGGDQALCDAARQKAAKEAARAPLDAEEMEMALEIFRNLDSDGSGTLSTTEVQVAGSSGSLIGGDLSRADADGDSEVTQDEWCHFLEELKVEKGVRTFQMFIKYMHRSTAPTPKPVRSTYNPAAFGQKHQQLQEQVKKLQEEASAALRLRDEAASLRTKLQRELQS